MNTHTVDPRTLWALLTMEVGLALPLISLPTQGDRLSGPVGPLLLVLLLPLGYVAVVAFGALRDPSWRIIVGVGAAMATRAIVSTVPEPGFSGLLVWFGRSVVPIVIGLALWWRGAGMSVAELTAAEVRTEFGVLSICLIAALAMVRPFLMADPLLLGTSVGVFAVGGLIAIVLSRQDAAELSPVPFGRLLGVLAALLPAFAAVVLVSILRPSLLTSMWLLLGRLIELVLTPIGWLIAWLASLLPRGAPPPPPQPAPRPTPDLTPDPAALAALEERVGWIGYVVLFTLLLAAALVAILLVRVMLENWLDAPTRGRRAATRDEVSVEATGAPGSDAHDVLAWLREWLRSRIRRRQTPVARQGEVTAADAWTAYKRLLDWAARQGLVRHPTETARELESRLAAHTPDAAAAVALVTETYESDRYGSLHPPNERLQRVREALASLADE